MAIGYVKIKHNRNGNNKYVSKQSGDYFIFLRIGGMVYSFQVTSNEFCPLRVESSGLSCCVVVRLRPWSVNPSCCSHIGRRYWKTIDLKLSLSGYICRIPPNYRNLRTRMWWTGSKMEVVDLTSDSSWIWRSVIEDSIRLFTLSSFLITLSLPIFE